MDYRSHLYRPLSKHFVDALVAEVFLHPTDFDLVYRLVFDEDITIAWRAAWACQKISEQHPEWFTEVQFLELAMLAIETKHSGLQRGCLSTLCNLNLPEDIPVELINACFDWMVSPQSAIAVQAKSMHMLMKICEVIPEFKIELKACLNNIDYESYSAGFKSTRKQILKTLNRK
ncbi:MAG: hypothetical protein PHV20_09565 [Bacteroidales bacterium]|nr:hypothetical protein [Bacteroidales bacterium]